jgi:hypothetical protein
MSRFLTAGLWLALVSPTAAMANTDSEIAALRQEIEAIRASYEARLQALEQRLKAAEGQAATQLADAPPSAPTTVAVPPPATPPPAPSQVAATPGGASAFNPSISLILSGLYTGTSRDPATYSIGGFPLPPDAEIGPVRRGFSLAETELGFAASIDPWFQGAANLTFAADNSVSVEEAYVQTTALGNGLSLKAGRFFSNVGYLNPQHSHTWDFVDNPLAYQAMLGTQYGDDGVRLTWLAPTERLLEFTAELGRGRTFPGGDNNRNGAGMASFSVHTGDDIGDSHSWRAGLSFLSAKADDQALALMDAAGNPAAGAFSGSTNVWLLDGVWKWAPNGNATRTNFKLQGEYLYSTRSGTLVYEPASLASSGSYRVGQSGWYVQGVYQFMPRWRVGLRTERLDPGNPDYGANTGLIATTDYRPRKNTLMFDFNPSEFSRIRLQFAQDRARESGTDNQVFLQYQMSLGAHGAHSY